MSKKLNEIGKATYKSFHIPGCTAYYKRPKNAIYFNPTNSLAHELKKAEICYELQKTGCPFITEAARNVKKGEEEKIVDVVDLNSNKEIEIIYKNESHQEVFEYRKQRVIPIIVNPFRCKKCNLTYPIKLKKHKTKQICDICSKNTEVKDNESN